MQRVFKEKKDIIPQKQDIERESQEKSQLLHWPLVREGSTFSY